MFVNFVFYSHFMYSTTEITSHEIVSDNPIHQRLFFAYQQASRLTSGKLLEIGVGVGRGLEVMLSHCEHYTGLDKNETLIQALQSQYPQASFLTKTIPPLSDLPSDHFDWVISFQVIEHIQQNQLFVKEIYRVLKPEGRVILTTPNRRRSLTRNPWHVREYLPEELEKLLRRSFDKLELAGVHGNEKVEAYFEENRKSVERITRWDILNLQYLLPAFLLKIPYDLLNRRNRRKLLHQTGGLAADIHFSDYYLSQEVAQCLDLFYIATK
jgi:2-polyprenyl-3-methyl-5-hydroxy-6-metoxy-1,4-benzoquinol methylase